MVNIAKLESISQKIQAGEQLTSQEYSTYQKEQSNISQMIGRQQVQQTQPVQKTQIEEYKDKGYEITETKGGGKTVQTPIKTADGIKYRSHILTFDKEGNISSDMKYKTNTHKGSTSSYLIKEVHYYPKKGTKQERTYDIVGYTTKLRSDKTIDISSNKVTSQDRWETHKEKSEEPTSKEFYYNPITETYTTTKIKGQEPVTKDQALGLTKEYISKGKAPFLVDTGKGYKPTTTEKFKGLYEKSQLTQKEITPKFKTITLHKSTLATPTYSASEKRKDYFIPLKKKFDYSAVAYKPYGKGSATVYPSPYSTKVKTKGYKEKIITFLKKPVEERRKITIEKVGSMIEQTTKNIFSRDPLFKKSIKAYEKTYGLGHGTPKEQFKALPYSIVSGFAQLPTFALKGYDVLMTSTEKGGKEASKKVIKGAKGIVSAYEKAPITTVGTFIGMGFIGKKLGQIKQTEKPFGISTKGERALRTILKEESPDVILMQLNKNIYKKSKQFRDVETTFKGSAGEVITTTRQKATQYYLKYPEEKAFLMMSKPKEPLKFFSVTIKGETLQTFIKEPYVLDVAISKKGIGKFEVSRIGKKGGKKLLDTFEKRIDPLISVTEPVSIFKSKKVKTSYPKIDDYYKFGERYKLQEMLYGKRKNKKIPKEIYEKTEGEIFLSKFVKVKESKEIPIGFFVSKVSSKLKAKTLEPATMLKVGKPVITEGMKTTPEFLYKDVIPTEYKFTKATIPKRKTKVEKLESGETLIDMEAISKSSQIYEVESFGEISFKEQPTKKVLPYKFKKEKPKDLKAFKWLGETKEKPVSISSLNKLVLKTKTVTQQIRQLPVKIDMSKKIYDVSSELKEMFQVQKQKPKATFGIVETKKETRQKQKPKATFGIVETKTVTQQTQREIQRPVQTQKNIQRQIQRSIQKQSQVQRTVQNQLQIQKQNQLQIQKQNQLQIQQQLQIQLQMQKQALTPTPTFAPKLMPPLETPPIIIIPPTRKKEKELFKGFAVLLKSKQLKKGKGIYQSRGFERIKTKPLTREGALGLGASIADETTQRSFKIMEISQSAVADSVLEDKWKKLSKKFRPKKKDKGVFVEKSAYAIGSMKEIEGIPMEAKRQKR